MCSLSQQTSKIEELRVSVIKLLNSNWSVSNWCKNTDTNTVKPKIKKEKEQGKN